ncbi:MAG: DUF167 domain-containing protein [Microthrixaceae bacterium]
MVQEPHHDTDPHDDADGAVEKAWARRSETGWMLSIRVQPAGGCTRVVGLHGDALKIRVSAPANEGKANAELIRFLADTLGVGRSDVRFIRGQRNREKVVEVRGGIGPLLALVEDAQTGE